MNSFHPIFIITQFWERCFLSKYSFLNIKCFKTYFVRYSTQSEYCILNTWNASSDFRLTSYKVTDRNNGFYEQFHYVHFHPLKKNPKRLFSVHICTLWKVSRSDEFILKQTHWNPFRCDLFGFVTADFLLIYCVYWPIKKL